MPNTLISSKLAMAIYSTIYFMTFAVQNKLVLKELIQSTSLLLLHIIFALIANMAFGSLLGLNFQTHLYSSTWFHEQVQILVADLTQDFP